MMKSLRNKKKKGFTLVELIVVIVIIGILAAIAIPRLSGFTRTAEATKAESEARTIITAVSSQYAQNNGLTSFTEATVAPLTGTLTGVIATPTVAPGGVIGFTYTLGRTTITVVDGQVTTKVTTS